MRGDGLGGGKGGVVRVWARGKGREGRGGGVGSRWVV